MICNNFSVEVSKLVKRRISSSTVPDESIAESEIKVSVVPKAYPDSQYVGAPKVLKLSRCLVNILAGGKLVGLRKRGFSRLHSKGRIQDYH